MRLIDADALIERMYHDAFETDTDMQKWDSGCWIRYKLFENAIDAQPTIDAVSVVRCAECRWSRPRTLKGETGYRCVFYRVDKAENGYCDCGERKESE